MTPLSGQTTRLLTITLGARPLPIPHHGPTPACSPVPAWPQVGASQLHNTSVLPPRFSGVTEADLADTSISLRDVQAVLLSMFSSDTVLIGHSLESDLLALKVPCSLHPDSRKVPRRQLGPIVLSPGRELWSLSPGPSVHSGTLPDRPPTCLQVIHSTVVDTSVLFPHRLGLPYKRSLRNLMADYLRQIIQDNGECWGTGTWGP